MNKNVELLAPAGSLEALKAAVQAGCNAVYLGGANFGARAYAKNFQKDELIEAIKYCHLRDVKIFVTVNTLIKDEELKAALDYAVFLYEAGVDAIIVQDLGFANQLRKILPDFDLHASTQMTIYDEYGAKFVEDMGIKRVILARETNLLEIEKIKNNTEIEIEAFAHGALCVSFSGQCLMSSLIGGRSGNRGRCAQPCRKPYKILDATKREIKGEKYYISPRDLSLGNHIREYIEKDIDSIKIEGRMKRPEYVYQAVKTYRNIIDGYEKASDMIELKSIFNRSFTKGLPLKDFANDYINTNRPNNQGIICAEIINSSKKGLLIKAINKMNPKDTIELKKNGENFVFTFPKSLEPGEKFLWPIKFKPDDKNIRRIVDNDLIERINQKLESERFRYPIKFRIELKLGALPKLEAMAKNEKIKVYGDTKIEASKNRPLTQLNIEEQLSKTGDSIFYLDELTIDIDENIFMPLKDLNALRRKAISNLENRLENRYPNRKVEDIKIETVSNNRDRARLLTVEILDTEIFQKLPLDKIDRIYFRYKNNLHSDILIAKKYGIECVISTENISNENDYKFVESIACETNVGIEAESLSSMYRFRDFKLYGGLGLNNFNSLTSEYLNQLNLQSILISPEIGLKEINSMRTSARLEYLIYGFLPTMTLNYCPASSIKNCADGEHCEGCNFKTIYLKDELGVEFPVIRNGNISKIYNAYPIFLLDRIEELKGKIDGFRLKFISKDEPIENIVALSKTLLERELNDSDLEYIKSKLKTLYGNITVGRYLKSAE